MKPGSWFARSRPHPARPRGPAPRAWAAGATLMAGLVTWAAAPAAPWENITAAAPWTARGGHACLAHQGRLWILGGSVLAPGGTTDRNDVWSSPDGEHWSQAVGSAPWGVRSDHQAVAFRDRIWILGGHTLDARENRHVYYRDVWCSSDGVAWTMVTNTAPWAGRSHHAAVVHQDRLWILGGENALGENRLADVWSSSDGAHWAEVTPSAAWGGRSYAAGAVHADRIWILGGLGAPSDPANPGVGAVNRYRNDVWASPDGFHWTPVATQAAWTPRAAATAVSWRGQLLLLGGSVSPDSSGPQNDVWSSPDGITWSSMTTAAGWPRRAEHAAVSFADSVWVLGGGNHRARLNFNDVWRMRAGP